MKKVSLNLRHIVLLGSGLVAILLGIYVTSAAEPASQLNQTLSTPQLIELAVAQGEIDQGTANLYLAYALVDYGNLPAAYRSEVPWSGTLPLLHLREAVSNMAESESRTAVEKLLAGFCSDSAGSLPNVVNSTYFHVEYNTIGGGLNINHYTTSVDQAWNREVNLFGWAAPPILASNPPPGNRYHVRIDDLGGGLYGYVTPNGAHGGFVGNNPNTAWNDGDAYATCMVLNSDFSGFPGTAQQALDATTAHEFNHSVQFGYGALTGSNAVDDIAAEGGATWMEEEVFDSANDNYNYLWPEFDQCMGQYEASPYPYWITYRGLTERFGTGVANGGEEVMQDFWEGVSQSSTNNMLTALNTALVNKGTNLASAYHAYAIAVKFNKSCGGGYSYPYCFEEGAAYVSAAGPTTVHGTIGTVGGSYNGSVQNNYALNWVRLPTGSGTYTVTLQNTGSGGQLRGSVVCDTGSTLSVTPFPAVVAGGGSQSIVNFNPSSCSSVVAVITNEAQTAANPDSCTANSYRVRTTQQGPPPADTFVFIPYVVIPPVQVPACNIGESDNVNNSIQITSGQTVCGQVNNANDIDDVYKLFVPNGQLLTITMTGSGTGDADLYLYAPDTTDVTVDPWTASSTNDGNSEFLQGVVSGGSDNWYIDIYAFSGVANYSVTAVISNPRTGEVSQVYTIDGQTGGSPTSRQIK